MITFPKILEYTWLVLAVVCLGLAIHSTVKFGFGQSYMLFILTFVAVLMYLLRRYRRKSLSSSNNSD
jgi:flagellar biogenesis protein FliO